MKFFLTLLIYLWLPLSSAKEISLSFDDAPRPATHLTGMMRATMLIESLKKTSVPEVAFFANSTRLDAEGKNRLLAYAKAGHIIANHTHSHPNINQIEVDQYIADIQKADEILSDFQGFKKWFRFPFLREGDSTLKRDKVRAALNTLGYKNAYITVNNYDWYMDSLFQRGLRSGKKVSHDALKSIYVQVLVESANFYDEMALAVLGRSPRHILLLHENDLAAHFIGDLVNALRSDGWTIISPALSYEDAISSYQSHSVFPNNPGRVGELAHDKKNYNQRQQLWHKACNEAYLENLFKNKKVFSP